MRPLSGGADCLLRVINPPAAAYSGCIADYARYSRNFPRLCPWPITDIRWLRQRRKARATDLFVDSLPLPCERLRFSMLPPR